MGNPIRLWGLSRNMCKKTQFKYCPSTIDKCMRNLIWLLKDRNVKTVACCCGHSKYPMTIVVLQEGYGNKWYPYEIMSGVEIPRKKKFYKKDEDGYYFIPETQNNTEAKK